MCVCVSLYYFGAPTHGAIACPLIGIVFSRGIITGAVQVDELCVLVGSKYELRPEYKTGKRGSFECVRGSGASGGGLGPYFSGGKRRGLA